MERDARDADIAHMISDVPARLGLKAAALAWLLAAQAFETCRPGQSRQIRLALARLWLEPRPVG
jgi:hypothetical protein